MCIVYHIVWLGPGSAKKKKKGKEYIPKSRSGAYAVLIALYQASLVTDMTEPQKSSFFLVVSQ